jgi:hypothetical protein
MHGPVIRELVECGQSDLLVITLVARASLPSPPCGCGHIVMPLNLVHFEAS